jgi:hypothetical protein
MQLHGGTMGEWNRTTRELSTRELQPVMTAALRSHAERYGIAIPLDEAVMCVETVSEKPGGLLGIKRPKKNIADAIVTPEWVVLIVRDADDDEAFAMSVRLREASVEDYHDSPLHQRIPDNGLHVSGLFTGRVGMHGDASTTSFMPLGDEPVAERFKQTLIQAVREAKP